MRYEEIFERIKKVTKIKNTVQLAKAVGCTQPTVSARKKQEVFPVDWAYKISKEYGLNIEWIMEGTGPQRPGLSFDDPGIIKQIRIWIQEQERREPGALAWFTYDFRKKYPEFSRWEKREEGDSVESDTGIKENTA